MPEGLVYIGVGDATLNPLLKWPVVGGESKMASRLIVGVTDHYRPPFDIEDKAFGGGVEFVDFNSRNEDDFDDRALRKLDVLLVYHARITEKTVDKLDNCKIIVRYGVGVDNMPVDVLERPRYPALQHP